MNNDSANWYLTSEVPCGTRSASNPRLQKSKPIKTAACGKRRAVILSTLCSTASSNNSPGHLAVQTLTQQRANSKHSKWGAWGIDLIFFLNKRFHQGAMFCRAMDFCTDLRHHSLTDWVRRNHQKKVLAEPQGKPTFTGHLLQVTRTGSVRGGCDFSHI